MEEQTSEGDCGKDVQGFDTLHQSQANLTFEGVGENKDLRSQSLVRSTHAYYLSSVLCSVMYKMSSSDHYNSSCTSKDHAIVKCMYCCFVGGHAKNNNQLPQLLRKLQGSN